MCFVKIGFMNKTYALITGASSGIGYQYARVLAEYGYNLIIVSNQSEALEEKTTILKSDFPSLDVVSLFRDLGCQDAAKELYDTITQMGLEVDVLVNNAGVYHDREFLDDSEKFNMLIMNLHMITPAMLTYYFGKDMVNRHKGYILNMSSVTSTMGFQRLATYSSTKAFLNNISRSTHIELYKSGVYVTCVRPGAVATDLYNIPATQVRIGLMLGYIITPEALARKAIKALMKGRARITPGISTKLLQFLTSLLPTWLLKLVHKLGIF